MLTATQTGMTAAHLTEYVLEVNATSTPEEVAAESLWPIAAGLGTALLMIAVLMCIFIWHRRRNSGSGANKKDEFIDDCIGGNVLVPVFEDDVPSVLELDMEDLDKWGMQTQCDRYKGHD